MPLKALDSRERQWLPRGTRQVDCRVRAALLRPLMVQRAAKSPGDRVSGLSANFLEPPPLPSPCEVLI